MIRPPGFAGAAFGEAGDGDPRRDTGSRRRISHALGIPEEWALVRQVHGSAVARAATPGDQGEADAIWTDVAGVPVAVGVADCVPVILEADGAVAVVHAGWRGLAAGVVQAALGTLAAAGTPVRRAAIGAAIGPCCYEVGSDVSDRFPRHRTVTGWGTTSVDLPAAVTDRLEGLAVWRDERCTRCSPELHSFRRTGTDERQVAVAWLPSG